MEQQKTIYRNVNETVYTVVQVQLRLSEGEVKELDSLVKGGKYKNRSDAIRAILKEHEVREKTRKFYEMLVRRSKEAREHPERLIPLERIG